MSQTNISLVALITSLTNRGIATDKTVADNNTASLAALALKAPLSSPALTGTPTTPTGTAGLSSQQIANGAWVLNEITTAISSAIRVAGDWDASGNLYPSATSGTGVSGAIRKGDQFTISVAGTLGGVLVEAASVVYAKIAAPGQTSTNWVILEHALQQATETLVGTVRFANLSETVDNSTPIATAAVSPMNLWQAFATYSSAVQEITGTWVFDNPLTANGGIIAGGQQINNLYNGSSPSDAVALNQVAGLYKGAFQSGGAYQIGDAVTYQGVLYRNGGNNASVDFYPMAWTPDLNSIPVATSQARKVLRSDGSVISYQLQPTNDVVGGAGIYTTLALATANSEYAVRTKGQIVTVTDDPTSANNGTYLVKSDLQLSVIPTSQFIMGQFGSYTATTAGVQTIKTLGSGAVGVFSVSVLEASGADRLIPPTEYSVSAGVLTIAAGAQVAAGDLITGYYYGANATGQINNISSIATASLAGIVKIGTGLSVATDGTISVISATDPRKDLATFNGARTNTLVLEAKNTFSNPVLDPNCASISAQVIKAASSPTTAVSAARTGTPAQVLSAINADIAGLSTADAALIYVRFITTPVTTAYEAHLLLTLTLS